MGGEIIRALYPQKMKKKNKKKKGITLSLL